jgi:hypothetical protein
MKQSLTSEAFMSFVLSAELLTNAQLLADTLAHWRQASISGAVRRALAYLPRNARIRAKIYPVI